MFAINNNVRYIVKTIEVDAKSWNYIVYLEKENIYSTSKLPLTQVQTGERVKDMTKKFVNTENVYQKKIVNGVIG